VEGYRFTSPSLAYARQPPLGKGALAPSNPLFFWGVGIMNRKHNADLTPNARLLRKNMTKEERHLWYDFLRFYPVRFLRQKVIDHYVVDFYCHAAKLIIEVDGSQHFSEQGMSADALRTEHIEARNLTVIRIPNNAISTNFEGVCAYIDQYIKSVM
jgi:very-short-patch-repair endonuclease